jgi:hypothetical protein
MLEGSIGAARHRKAKHPTCTSVRYTLATRTAEGEGVRALLCMLLCQVLRVKLDRGALERLDRIASIPTRHYK